MESPERKENRRGMRPVKRKVEKPERDGDLLLSMPVFSRTVNLFPKRVAAPRAFFQPKFGKD